MNMLLRMGYPRKASVEGYWRRGLCDENGQPRRDLGKKDPVNVGYSVAANLQHAY